MRCYLLAMAWFVPGAAVAADPAITVSPIVNARLRWEHVEQEGLASDADAVTARVRAGVQASRDGLAALVEAEAVLAIGPAYFDGLNGQTSRPLVADPENVELNRAQVAYRWEKGAIVAGRQRVELADQRFVASAEFRQNEQSFDAVRLQWSPLARLNADLTYSWSVRTIFGIQGRGARAQAIAGDNLFALIGYGTPAATLTGFRYVVDADELAVQGFRLSSASRGVRLAGTLPVGTDTALTYAASWARQRDHGRNPNRYRADYWLAEATAARGPLLATVGYEVLGGDDGRPLTSFQTPYAALFKFQGWADKFTTTPPDGVRDLYLGLGAGAKRAGPLGALTFRAAYHHFASDRLVRRYGDELDLLASGKLGRMVLSARLAHYRAHGFGTDTTKAWLTADWAVP